MCALWGNNSTMVSMVAVLLVIRMVQGGLVLPDHRRLPWDVYAQPGDVNIGGIFPIHRYSRDTLCSKDLLGTLQTQFVQAMAYAVDRVNERHDLLPNITLGYFIMDDCTSDTVALSRALSFIPSNDLANGVDKSGQEDGLLDLDDPSTGGVQNDSSSTIPHYDVVAVLGSMRSRNSILVAELLTLFQVR